MNRKKKLITSAIGIKSIFLVLIMNMISLCIHANAQTREESINSLEEIIEAEIRDSIGTRLQPSQYYIDVVPKVAQTQDEAQNDIAFTNLKINLKKLQELYELNKKPDFTKFEFQVEIFFDNTVPESLQKLIEKKVKRILKIDGTARTIAVNRDDIFPASEPPKSVDELPELVEANKKIKDLNDQLAQKIEESDISDQTKEAHQLALEKAKIELERAKLEAANKEGDLQAQLRAAQEAKKPQVQAKAKEDEKKEKETSSLDTVKDFQLTIVALIIGGVLFVGMSGTGKSSVTSSQNIGEAIRGVADGLGSIAAAQEASDDMGMDSGGGAEESGPVSEVDQATLEASQDVEQVKKFLVLIEEKIEVLSNDGNFNFYRHFIDIAQRNTLYASSILVSLGDDTAKKLVQNMPADIMTTIKNFLTQPGQLGKAKQIRAEALQEFYGLVAVDEYIGSPILEINNAEWLIKLSNAEMVDLIDKLEENDKAPFLACLTPTRVAAIIESVDDEGKRVAFLSSLKTIDTVDKSALDGLFTRAQEKYNELKDGKTDEVQKLIDGPQYFAKILQDISPDSRKGLMDTLSDRAELLEELSNYYVPFEKIAELATSAVKELFGRMNIKKVAIAIHDVEDVYKEKVMGTYNDAMQDSLKEELETIAADKVGANKNKKVAEKLRDEVCIHMLKLKKEGLLTLESDEQEAA